MRQLNAQQLAAVRYIDGPCLVLAGAGSGKTSVITGKIAYLVQQCGLPARSIAALTFTNKAAQEMKERAATLMKGASAKGLVVSTFHQLGLAIIRREHKLLGYRPGFSIFDSEDSRALIKELSTDNALAIKESELESGYLELVQKQIGQWKNNRVTPATALAGAGASGEESMAIVYRGYDRAMKAYNAVDFDDLIGLPVQCFNDHPEALARWQRRIRYLLVDEYQDTNISQYQLMCQLVGASGKLTVVGDDDQSIYAWRGARPENLLQLQADFDQLTVIKLEQNYRSSQRILKAANALISHNDHVFSKRLWSDNGYGEPIRVICNSNEEVEAERIATEIISQRLQRQKKFSDFAVFYRSNYQARLLELKLQYYQVPYHLSGGISFFSRTEIKDIMAYLRLLINPTDDNALLRIINTPRRQIGANTIESLSHYARERNCSLFEAIAEMGLCYHLPATALKRLIDFKEWINHCQRRCDRGEPIAAIGEMLEDMDYRGWLHQQAGSTTVAERRIDNVNYLIRSIENTLQRQQDELSTAASPPSLADAVAKLMLINLLERREEEDLTDRVQLMTLHAAKGLEFAHVFIIGMEEELLPHKESIAADNIEEERRLTYVGITRAQRSLVLSLAAKRKQFGEIVSTTPSRFLEELPTEDLQREGFGEHNPEINRATGAKTLTHLMTLFD